MSRLSHITLSCFAFAVFAHALAGCDDDGPGNAVTLSISPQMNEPYPFSHMEVSVTASRSEDAKLCEPVCHRFAIEGQENFPVVMDFVPGDIYRQWVAFRITCLQDGIEVFSREIIRGISDEGGGRELDVVIESACINKECEEGYQCDGGVCSQLPDLRPFDDPGILDVGVSCDSRNEIEQNCNP